MHGASRLFFWFVSVIKRNGGVFTLLLQKTQKKWKEKRCLSSAAPEWTPARQLHVQEFLGQSNLISINQGGQSALRQPCSNTPLPPTLLPSLPPSVKPCSHFPFFDPTVTPFHITRRRTALFPCNSIAAFRWEAGRRGIKEEECRLKNNLFKIYYTESGGGGGGLESGGGGRWGGVAIPLRRAAWLTPVRGMINDSIFCLCCLLPLAAAAIYHHPLSAVESGTDSASQQTFSARSRTARGNYYCQNNNGLA